MAVSTVKFWFICCTAALLTLFSSGYGSAASKTLHSESLLALEARAASANPDNWRFVFMGDNRGNDEKFKEALRKAIEFAPLFILHGGDIAETGTADELAHFMGTVSSVPGLPPLFVVRGNHEKNAGLYEKTIGARNFTLDSEKLGFRLVAVDNTDYALKEHELSYLDKMLDNRRPLQIVTMHIPPATERWKRHSFTKGKDDLVRLMTERKVKLGLFAHVHLYDQDEINGIPCIISGGAGAPLSWLGFSGEASYHIVVAEVNKGTVTYKTVQLK